MVIPGIGPAQVARSAPDAARAPGANGGGFLEYLVTGQSGIAARYNAPEGQARPIVGNMPAAPAHAVTRLAALAPGDASAEPGEVPDPQYRRQEVAYDGRERPGTIIIDTPDKFLFLIEPNGRALRYGVGVGRPGFEWSGVKAVSRKAEWPGWTPPAEMLLRRPELPDHMDGGPGNPLGARALYLGSSMYRIHGTNEPWTIGKNVSSGCIRMMNQDVIDLYNRVPVGARVVVI
jgi:lipoprotein-anchoring transpeptidase ErfK/SrfK